MSKKKSGNKISSNKSSSKKGSSSQVSALSLQERLLRVMDQKHHWGWEFLSGPRLDRHQLLIHFQQEYETYVRDFPVFLARIMGRMDASSTLLKREFAENLYEEQTGGMSKKISKGRSHPELFLKMMNGLGFKEAQFQKIEFLPTSLAYRCFLDRVTFLDDWRIAAAIMTLFVEGSVNDRARLARSYRDTKSLPQKLKEHALIRYHGLKEKDADLIKVHHAVEGDHRKSAWETVLHSIPNELEGLLVQRMEEALELWLLFRDGVCVEMGLESREFRDYVNAL